MTRIMLAILAAVLFSCGASRAAETDLQRYQRYQYQQYRYQSYEGGEARSMARDELEAHLERHGITRRRLQEEARDHVKELLPEYGAPLFDGTTYTMAGAYKAYRFLNGDTKLGFGFKFLKDFKLKLNSTIDGEGDASLTYTPRFLEDDQVSFKLWVNNEGNASLSFNMVPEFLSDRDAYVSAELNHDHDTNRGYVRFGLRF